MRASEIQDELDELRKSNNRLRRFVHLASHQLQAPARTAGNFAGLLAKRYEGELDEKAIDWIDCIVDCSRSMQQLVKGLVRYSEIGSQRPVFQRVDVDAIIAKVLAGRKEELDRHPFTVEVTALPVCFSDPNALVSVFESLVDNAIKFSRDCTGSLVISGSVENENAIYEVSDQGIGIDPEHHEQVFTLFGKLHSKSDFGGEGISLATCRALLEHQRGRIELESAVGSGSKFRLTLPNQPRDDGETNNDSNNSVA